MSSTQNYVTSSHLLSTSYAMMALTSMFVLARIAVQILHPKKLAPEDYLIYLAYVLYVVMSVLYILVTPPMYRLSDFISGKSPVYPLLMDDSMFIIKAFFANTMIFWCVLWMVKFSLLALYKRLLVGLHIVYIKIWWGVVCFCVLVCNT
jgi:magnesium-transporting ATPase (P-type)